MSLHGLNLLSCSSKGGNACSRIVRPDQSKSDPFFIPTKHAVQNASGHSIAQEGFGVFMIIRLLIVLTERTHADCAYYTFTCSVSRVQIYSYCVSTNSRRA